MILSYKNSLKIKKNHQPKSIFSLFTFWKVNWLNGALWLALIQEACDLNQSEAFFFPHFSNVNKEAQDGGLAGNNYFTAGNNLFLLPAVSMGIYNGAAAGVG